MKPTARGAAHRVRIIGGQWRRTPLAVVDAAGLRPTPDRVRETLFNWLGNDLSGLVCLDLYAGTGALGLEAASRGAATVWLADTEPRVQLALQAIIERLKAGDRVQLYRGDARDLLARLAQQGVRADVVFIDPPFRQGVLDAVMPALAPVLAREAWVYVETEAPLAAEQVVRWCGPDAQIVRQASAGQVHYHLLRIHSEATQEKT
ncbi:MAG: 16S rRNA (guanine(966)-N(2))-methyltransferase RsmD [Burkholderiaceae bacterium]|nr:16S rRNA (guanine(966)-N(2))-methyltransferase RsmD [Burkholderiaceae bacterium]